MTSSNAIPTSTRLQQRQTYGSTLDMFNAAIAELDAGNVQNAWASLRECLAQAMLERWRAFSGKPNSPPRPHAVLLKKLQSAQQMDAWVVALLTTVVDGKCRTKRISRQHVDYLAGIVRVFVLETPATPITPAMPVVEAPDHRDARQTEQWLPLPAAEPVEPETEVEIPQSSEQPFDSNVAVGEPRYLPTLEEIDRECEQIQSEWTEQERKTRWLQAHSIGTIEGMECGWTAPGASICVA